MLSGDQSKSPTTGSRNLQLLRSPADRRDVVLSPQVKPADCPSLVGDQFDRIVAKLQTAWLASFCLERNSSLSRSTKMTLAAHEKAEGGPTHPISKGSII